MTVRQRRPARRPVSARVLAAGLLFLLAFFTTALAAGSRDIGMALLAFVLFGGGVAFVTYERITAKLRRRGGDVTRTPPGPVEEFVTAAHAGGARGPAEEAEDDPGGPRDGELASIDDLEARLRTGDGDEPADDPDADAVDDPDPPPPAPVRESPEAAEPAPRIVRQRQPALDAHTREEVAARNDRYTAVGHIEDLGDPMDGPRAFVSGESFLPAASVRDVAVTLVVADLGRSTAFYVDLLGLVELDRSADAVLLEAGFGRVLLCRRDDAPSRPSPLMHLALEVPDVDAAFLQLQDRGVVFGHGPRAAITGEAYEVVAASFHDPDGHGLAITEIRER